MPANRQAIPEKLNNIFSAFNGDEFSNKITTTNSGGTFDSNFGFVTDAVSNTPRVDYTSLTTVIDAARDTGFTMPVPFDIVETSGVYTDTLDITDYKITPTTTYYVTTSGNNGNSGLTEGLAKADIDGAITAGNLTGTPYQVNVKAGTYARNRDWLLSPTQDCNVIGYGGNVAVSAEWENSTNAGSYTLTTNNTYKATRSVVTHIYDSSTVDANGDFERLTLAASQAACEATAGTFYTDNIDYWVHTSDERDLSSDASDMKVFLSVSGARAQGDFSTYVEGIDFEGWSTGFISGNLLSTDDTRLYMNNCSMKYTSSGNGLAVQGTVLTILKDCVASQNYLDGFNYHLANTVVPDAIEVDCLSRLNGYSGSESNNATTMHDGGRILRLNGDYGTSEGRNVHDIGAGTESLNIACNAHDSRNTTTTTGSINWTCGDNTGTTMWLIDCLSSGSLIDWKVDTSDTLYINNDLINSTATVENGTLLPLTFPVSPTLEGLHYEVSRTNLLTYTKAIGGTDWGSGGSVTLTQNYGVSPDGLTTSTRMVGVTTNDGHVLQSIVTVDGTTYTGSVWMKGSGTPRLRFQQDGGAFANYATLDITPTSEWVRYDLTFTKPVDGSNTRWAISGVGGDTDVEVWGAQMEVGDFVTSFIPTVASSVTRTADLNTTPNPVDFSQPFWAVITLTVDETTPATFTFPLAISDGTFNNRVVLEHSGSGNLTWRVMSAGVNQVAGLGAHAVVQGEQVKMAISCAENDFRLSINGATVVEDTSGLMPVGCDRVDFGHMFSNGISSGHTPKAVIGAGTKTNAWLEAAAFLTAIWIDAEVWVDAVQWL